MKLSVDTVLCLLVLLFLSKAFIGCAPTVPRHAVTEITDEKEVQGCKNIGLVTGKSHWGGLTGQELSLKVAKKRALDYAGIRGATHVIWLQMKRDYWGATVLGEAYVCAGTPTATSDTAKIIPLSTALTQKKTVAGGAAAVMRFESAGIDSGVSLAVTDVFTNQIQAQGRYRVMERSQMAKILHEQGFQSSGACSSTECAIQIGHLLSIDKMFIGSIGKLGDSWVINVRVIDIQTGEILATVSKQVKGKADTLSAAAIQIANELSQ